MNMFNWRLTSEAQPRSKNGSPPQTTTGVASANSTQTKVGPDSQPGKTRPGTISAIESNRSGKVSARLIQNRRVMSASSGSTSASAETVIGSKAIPQIGQDPGRSRLISGCIGQV